MKILKLCTIFLATFLVSTINYAQLADTKKEELIKLRGNEILQEAIRMEEHVGVTGGIYADGKIMWTGGAGYRDLKEKKSADGMIARIASISKPMTAVAIFQLVEQGKLDLDAPIQQYVPEFPSAAAAKITTRYLLAHS
ncbi:MAG: serine hydrolase domain-containing protein, partial [Bacteroidota bacterium]